MTSSAHTDQTGSQDEPTALDQLLAQFPVTAGERPIVRYTSEHSGYLADSFQEAARRIASSFTGSAPDDRLLMPYLYLYRHAIELELKHVIQAAAGMRRRQGNNDPELEPTKLEKRLRNTKTLGHKIPALLDELAEHVNALGGERLPADTDTFLRDLAAADPDGQQFRYRTKPPAEQTYVDFDTLNERLEAAYTMVGVTIDALEWAVEATNAKKEYGEDYGAGLEELQ